MNTLTINISDEKLNQLKQIAQKKGITTEELLQSKINEWLTENPDNFDQIADYVLKKNAELYKRLA